MKRNRSVITVISALFAAAAISSSYAQAPEDQVSLPEGSVIRLALSAHTPVGHVGQQVEATVVEPVYLYDRIIIPMNTKAHGQVVALHSVPFGERIRAISGGDFTPLKDPEIQFDQLTLPQGQVIAIKTDAIKRNTQVVELRDPQAKRSFGFAQLKSQLRERLGMAGGPSKMDRIKNELYSFLPYHPQALDRGSLFDAVLLESLQISVPAAEPRDLSHLGQPIPPDTLAHARLLVDVSSSDTQEGTTIKAVLTEPILGAQNELLYPEGTVLTGTVLKAKPAGSLGRSGELRIAFQSLQLPAGPETRVETQIEAVEAQKGANVTIDAEGGTQAHPGQRFIGPLYHGFLAGAATAPGNSRMKRAVVSNGFRLVGRIAGAAGPTGVSTGFAYYGLARSVYLHLLRKGPEVSFAKDTRLDIRLTQRP